MMNITLKAIGLAALIGLTAALPAQAAVVDWNGHSYDVISSPGIDWPTANAAANAMTYGGLSGHLATITSADEDAFLSGLIANQPGEFWAGGFQKPIDETVATAGWAWVNWEGAFGYQNWQSGEPNDYFGSATEQYLGLGLYRETGGWNDEGNVGLIAGYLVEYERSGVPEGAAGLAGIVAIVGLLAAHRRIKKA